MLAAARMIAALGSIAAVLASDEARLVRAADDSAAAAEVVDFARIMRRLLLADLTGRPVVSSSAALRDYLMLDMAGDRSERVRLLYLDVKSRLISDETIFVGTVDATAFSPREVVRRALDLNASSFIVVHNHPSGDPAPSAADLRRTREVSAAAMLFGIEVVDHIVIASGGIISIMRPDAA